MNENNDVVVVSFGKYKNKPLAAIPSDYIGWCLTDASVIERDQDLKVALEDELVNRLITIPVKDRSPLVTTFITAYDNHKKNADIDEPEFQRIVVDKLYDFLKAIKNDKN